MTEILAAGLVTLSLAVPSEGGSPDRPRKSGALQEPADAGSQGEMIRPSGLQHVFPDKARCPEIASPYGSQTRYDGSRRPRWAFGGYHGGIDISLAEGTSLLALAAGAVISKGEGGQMEGIYLWLRHSPEDSGLHYWVYSKYQHLQTLPELAIGARVAVGEVVARSGKTGTTGGHYGAHGYPHLHLTTRKGSNDDQKMGSPVAASGRPLIDPLAIYYDASPTRQEPANPPSNKKDVAIPYMTAAGQIWPPGTRVVWPVACATR
jgi:murein DD-endopeptidase MepM/ murein hydrolase activator NlpD